MFASHGEHAKHIALLWETNVGGKHKLPTGARSSTCPDRYTTYCRVLGYWTAWHGVRCRQSLTRVAVECRLFQ